MKPGSHIDLRPTRPLNGRRSAVCRANIVAGAIAALVLAACTALPTRAIINDHDVALQTERHQVEPLSTTSFSPPFATPAQRDETLNRVWRTIRSSYFDPTFGGLDVAAVEAASRDELTRVHSDAEFYDVLERSVAALHDSHTFVESAADAEIDRTQQARLIGVTYSVVDQRVVLIGVAARSPASEAGIKKGMLLIAVDGHALDAAFLDQAATVAPPFEWSAIPVAQDVLRRSRQLAAVAELLTSEGTPVPVHRLTLLRADGSPFEAEVQARPIDLPSTVTFTTLTSGVAVLQFNRFDYSLVARIAETIDSVGSNVAGLVIDLRGNGGGALDVYASVMNHLLDHPEIIGQVTHRFWFGTWKTTLESDPVAHPYVGRIAVLVDGSTASSAELMAQALVELRGAIVIGEPTCGCVVAIRDEFVLPDGGMLRVAQADVRSAKGRRLEGDPVLPSITATPTLSQLRSNDDAALDAAVDALTRH